MRRLLLGAAAMFLIVGAACNQATTETEETTDGDNGAQEEQGPEDGAGDDRVAEASTYAGEWEGEWRNLKFNSSGSIEATVTVDADAKTITITFDAGGFVFGESDPAPITVTGSLDGRTEFSGDIEVYGPVEVTFDWDTMEFTVEANDVPSDGIKSASGTGKIEGNTITAETLVTFPDGSTAEGTFELTKK